jgi:hypothetical protein
MTGRTLRASGTPDTPRGDPAGGVGPYPIERKGSFLGAHIVDSHPARRITLSLTGVGFFSAGAPDPSSRSYIGAHRTYAREASMMQGIADAIREGAKGTVCKRMAGRNGPTTDNARVLGLLPGPAVCITGILQTVGMATRWSHIGDRHVTWARGRRSKSFKVLGN